MEIISIIRQYLDDSIINLIVAAVLGVLLDRAREKVKRLWWGVKDATCEVDYFGKDGGFTIRQNGHKKTYRQARDLSLCRFVFWSSGKELLKDSDISKSGSLVISFDYRCDIYGVENIISSNRTIDVQAINLHQIAIDFEYLEPNEGAVFDVFYAGNNAEPYLDGIIKGGKISIKKMNPPDLSHMPKHKLLFGWLKPAPQIIAIRWFYTVGFIGMIYLLLMLFSELPTILRSGSPDFKTYTVLMIIRATITLFIATGMGIYLWQLALVPKKLRRYYENIVETKNA